VHALAAFARGDEYAALATTFRRMNILKQADLAIGEPDPARQDEPAERALHAAWAEAAGAVASLCERHDYAAALGRLAALRPPVDAFFDQVKVMADNAETRANRLALLSAVDRLFRRVADFKLIAG
jgi:glycyl-tRNA synthetase beta chain